MTESDRIKELQLELELLRERKSLLNHTQKIVDNYGIEMLRLMLGNSEAVTSPESEIIFGSSGGRSLLLQTLESAKERVIVVCPWLRRHSITNDILLKLRSALDQGVQIDIGWGYQHDIGTLIKFSDQGYYIDARGETWQKYNALPQLRELEKWYPHFQLKLLPTHGKYWICDRKFAYVGSYNVLSATLSEMEKHYPDLSGDEVGTLHRSPRIIQTLIQRFDHQFDQSQTQILQN